MHRNTDRSRLIGDRSCDRLTDPPGRICGELITLAVIKFFDSLNKTQISLLDQIKEKHTTANITFCNGYYQS